MRTLLIALALALLLPAAAAAFDVEYNTAGAPFAPATLGGDRDGWGTEFVALWHNTTGADVIVEELAWPCGGWWAQFWYVWITDVLPANPWTLEHYGTFVSESEDDTEWPPSTYTVIDVSGEGIIVPAGGSMVFGYSNPGMGGQVSANGTSTWSWLDDGWDLDSDFGRTAVLQFRGTFGFSGVDGPAAAAAALDAHPNPFNPATTIAYRLEHDGAATVDVLTLQGRRVRRLVDGPLAAGDHQVRWDGTDDAGRALPSGTYLLRLQGPDGVQGRKLVLAR